MSIRAETAARGGAVLVARFAVIAAINYALSVVLAWLLPAREYGLVSAIQAALLLAALALNSGFSWTVAVGEARCEGTRTERARADSVIRSAVVGNVVFATVISLVLLALVSTGVHVLPRTSPMLLLAMTAAILVFAFNAVVRGTLHGRGEFGGYGLMQALEVAVKGCVAVALIVWLGWGGEAIAVAFLVGGVAATGVGLRALRGHLPGRGGFAPPSAFRSTGPMFVGTAGFAIFTTFDILALNAIGYGSGVTAITLATYQVAVLLTRAPYYIADALSDAVFPFIARRHDDPSASHAWFTAAGRWALIIAIPIEVALALRPAPFLVAFFPDSYIAAAPVVRVLAIGAVGVVACGAFGKALQALGRQDLYARVMTVMLVFDVVLLLALVPRLAALGASLAFSVSAWLGAFALGALYYRQQRVRPPASGSVLRYGAALSAMGLVLVLGPATTWVSLVVVIALAACSYGAVAVALRIITTADLNRLWRLLKLAGAQLRLWATAVLDAGTSAPGLVRRSWRAAAQALVNRACLLGLVMFSIASPLLLLRIDVSPDTQYDEVVYTRAAQEVAASGHLTWSTEPVLVHPPLYFLLQAGWLRLLGMHDAPLTDAITSARCLTALVAAVVASLLGLLVLALSRSAGDSRRLALALTAATLATSDPSMLRYSRLAVIEPLALAGILATLLAAWAARRWTALRHVTVVGLLAGATLLVKEVAGFLLIAPLLFALLERDTRYLRRQAAALGFAVGIWAIFPVWAVSIGVLDRFSEVKLLTLKRLIGTLQVTGWNRDGVSFGDALVRSAAQYLSSYALLGLGAACLLWLMFRRNEPPASFLLAILGCAYAFGAYIVVLGSLNEQFFVYIVAPAIAGVVLTSDALATRGVRHHRAAGRTKSWAVVVPVLGLVLILGIASSAYVAQYAYGRNDGLRRMTAFVESEYPACTVVNASGDAQKYTHLMGGRPVTEYGSGAAALARGVHLFFLTPGDVFGRYGAMSPHLARWIRAHGSKVASFSSWTYGAVHLYEVPADEYDPAADVQTMSRGVFVHTRAAACGGFTIRDGAGAFLTGYLAMGGKSVVGFPLTRVWHEGGVSRQVFSGAVLQAHTDGATDPVATRARPIVAELEREAPLLYERHDLPPVTWQPSRRPALVLSRLNDRRIAERYLGGVPRRMAGDRDVLLAVRVFGAPLGPAKLSADGAVRQAFERVVLERPADRGVVRAAPVGHLLQEAQGLAPTSAVRPETSPAVTAPAPRPLPSGVKPFLALLLPVLLGAGVVAAASAVSQRREEHGPRVTTIGGSARPRKTGAG